MPAAAAASKAADQEKDYSQESFVIEKVLTRFRFESDGTGRKETIARVRVQSEAGVEQWGQVLIGYNSANERVEIPYVRVLKKDGSVVTAPADSVQDLSCAGGARSSGLHRLPSEAHHGAGTASRRSSGI